MDKEIEQRQEELRVMEENINRRTAKLEEDKLALKKLFIQLVIRGLIVVLACGYLGYTLAKPFAHYVFISENLELQAKYQTYDIEIIKEAK